MALDDAIHRAQVKADADDNDRRTEARFQTSRVPTGVVLAQGLLRDAARAIAGTGAKPMHLLRCHGARSGLLDQLRPSELRYAKLASGWIIGRRLLGVDGKLYETPYSRTPLAANVQTIKDATRAQKAGNHRGFRLEELRGVLRLGLVPGDRAMIVNRSDGTAELKVVNLVKNMSASAAEPHQSQPGRSYDFDGLQRSTEFVISPSDTIFVSMGGYDFSSYLRLEDELADAVVKLQ